MRVKAPESFVCSCPCPSLTPQTRGQTKTRRLRTTGDTLRPMITGTFPRETSTIRFPKLSYVYVKCKGELLK